jgi:hypothetical protein
LLSLIDAYADQRSTLTRHIWSALTRPNTTTEPAAVNAYAATLTLIRESTLARDSAGPGAGGGTATKSMKTKPQNCFVNENKATKQSDKTKSIETKRQD